MRVGVAAGLMALGTVATAADAVPQSLPTLSSQGIARASILCLLTDDGDERMSMQTRLCEQVRAVAAKGAPVPVETIGFGDPLLIRRDTLGVLVHAAIDRSGPAPRLILSIRPNRTETQASVLFGATPQVVALGRDGKISEAAIAAALDQVLPWRMRARG